MKKEWSLENLAAVHKIIFQLDTKSRIRRKTYGGESNQLQGPGNNNFEINEQQQSLVRFAVCKLQINHVALLTQKF